MNIEPELYNYWVVVVLMMAGFYTVISRGNLIKKLIGLNVFQVSVFMLYISMGKVDGGIAPILIEPMPAHGAASHGDEDHHADNESHAASTSHHDDGDEHSSDDQPPSEFITDAKIAERLSSGSTPDQQESLVTGDHPPEVQEGTVYSNPLPHVLILTAIVVGVATTSLGLALVVRINEAYGTIEEDEIQSQDDDS